MSRRDFILAIVIVLVAGLIVVATDPDHSFKQTSCSGSEQALVKQDRYQALFLAGGGTYYGKLEVNCNEGFMTLKDVYYIKNNTLVKLGNEQHGPEDAMQVSRGDVSFWENLKPTGKVSQAIETFKRGGKPELRPS